MSHHVVKVTTYTAVFVALLILLVLTVVAAEIEHEVVNNVVAMTIAVTKMILIMLFFMHLSQSSRVTLVFAFSGFLWLVILMALTIGDYETREFPLTPPAEGASGPGEPGTQ